ncbi:MAG TPA: MOSC domain-containing protein [Ktedonobacterales bacterium]|nr:MOSC domain-containing protein [Ktedonobacterales bacterium]
MVIGVVADLWQYPVKSLLGEQRERVWLDQRGVIGDRLYAVRDEAGKFGSGKTTRRFRRIEGLFRFRAVYDGDVPLLTFPDGTTWRGDDPAIHAALSTDLRMPVTLSREAAIPHFDAGPLHLLTTASLRTLGTSLSGGSAEAALDRRRFRPNILIETEGSGFLEDAWQGRDIVVGTDVRLRVVGRTERCVMVNLAQDELPADARILRQVVRVNAACLGVYAEVLTPGVIRVGDHIELL